MNKQKAKDYAEKYLKTIQNKTKDVIALFPLDVEWDDRHVRMAVKIIIEKPNIDPKLVIKRIKISYLCTGEGHLPDAGDGNVLLTDEERRINEEAISK